MIRRWREGLILAGAVALFGAASQPLNRLPRSVAPDQLDVAIAPPVQVMLAAGDRYLAANLNATRVTVLNVLGLDKQDYQILARIHRDIAFLQPCQEDNYYLAQAFLPWIGEIAAADEVLSAAATCRQWDVMPGFYLAFNAFYFHKDNRRAGQLYADTASRGNAQQRDQLLYMASKFFEKGDNLGIAANVIRGLKSSAVNPQLRLFLEARALRVERLSTLREAAAAFLQRHGRTVKELQELVATGMLEKLPEDPLGKGFTVDSDGVIQLRN